MEQSIEKNGEQGGHRHRRARRRLNGRQRWSARRSIRGHVVQGRRLHPRIRRACPVRQHQRRAIRVHHREGEGRHGLRRRVGLQPRGLRVSGTDVPWPRPDIWRREKGQAAPEHVERPQGHDGHPEGGRCFCRMVRRRVSVDPTK